MMIPLLLLLCVGTALLFWKSPRELIVQAKDFSGLYLVEGHSELIYRAAAESQVSPLLIAGVMYAESRGRGGQISSAGALGLMQLIPAAGSDAARRLGLPEPTDEQLQLDDELNVRLGAAHLAWLIEHRGSWDLEQVLVSYNAGRARLKGWIEDYGSYRAWRVCELEEEAKGRSSGALNYALTVLDAMERFRQRGVFQPTEAGL